MVDFIKRDKDDIYSKPVLGFLFKNQKFLLIFRIIIVGLFFWAIYLGFSVTGKENTFTPALFWGIFWSFFMVLTLPTFGRIFCGICPHGFLGKYITKFGLKKTMPKWMQNRYIGILFLVIGWWGVYYMFPGIYRTPYGTAMMFTIVTVLAFIVYFIYKDMSYCKYICPIGTLTRAYAKLGFTKLGSYSSACNECKTFDCAKACPYNLKPFTFDKRNSMTDCTLCMECSHSCEAINFKFTAPAESLNKKFQVLGAEVWTYMLILASIPISMAFAHGLNRSKISDEFIWNKTAKFFESFIDFGSLDTSGLFAWLYALVFTILSATIGMYIASKILKKDFKSTFYSLGYSYAPLFILGSLSHTLSFFFTRGYDRIIEGFVWGFGFGTVDIASLAGRNDKWLAIFGLLKWVAVIWALIILYRRLKLIESSKIRKIFAYIFASSLIIFFLAVNIYRGYILDTYGRKSGGMHGMHGMNMGKMFQSVPKDKAILLQKGKNKASCIVCGMKLPMFYKTNHASIDNNTQKQYCSIHCLYEDLKINKKDLKDIKVVDTKSLKFIDAKKAFYVVGSRKKGTMSEVSKYAFASKSDAIDFVKKYGGEIVDFNTALNIAKKDFIKEKLSVEIKPNDTIYFVDKKTTIKKGNSHGGHMMHMGGRNRSEVPSKKLWLVTDDINKPKCVKNINGKFYVTDVNNNLIRYKLSKRSQCKSISFKMPKSGYYNTYYVQDIYNYINIAKYEFKRFDHSSDEKYDKKKMSAKTIDKVPFDILRLRNDDETFYSRLQTGQSVRFKVLHYSKPVKNATVTLVTQFGWSKSIKTNKDGIAKIQLIKDYNPSKEKFNKRFKEKFLVTATYSDDYKSYKISYLGIYTPSRSMYQSTAYGLIIAILIFIAGSAAIFIYRYKTTKPFKEIQFDEK